MSSWRKKGLCNFLARLSKLVLTFPNKRGERKLFLRYCNAFLSLKYLQIEQRISLHGSGGAFLRSEHEN